MSIRPRRGLRQPARRGRLLCSIAPCIALAEHDEVRERRRQLRRPVYQKPELLAEGPNEVWSWDITKLMGPAKWITSISMSSSIFQPQDGAWCIADAESATLFKPCSTTRSSSMMSPGQLALHADRGGPMKAKATALLLADLGVTTRIAGPTLRTTTLSRKATSRPKISTAVSSTVRLHRGRVDLLPQLLRLV